MTSKEALEMLKSCGTNTEEPYESKIIEALETLVERDTPKKPTPQFPNTTFMYWCPKCDCISIQRYDKHCHDCGQRLDWSGRYE